MARLSEVSVPALPHPFIIDKHTCLLMIDMQRDFLLAGGFGEIQGSDLGAVQSIIPTCASLLALFRSLGLPVIHTREGHVPSLKDCPYVKQTRQAKGDEGAAHKLVIGDRAAMGKMLVRGEYGHDLVDECAAKLDELVIDKPGKGAFWATGLLEELRVRGVRRMVVAGVTTECCVTTTVREANDRGLDCCIVEECTSGYNASFKVSSLDMIHWANGLFGFTCKLPDLKASLEPFLVPVLTAPPTPARSPASETAPSYDASLWDGELSLNSLRLAYKKGLSPATVVSSAYARIMKYIEQDSAVFTHLVPMSTALTAALALSEKYPNKSNRPPLFGFLFSVKDSINVAGIPTTTGCPSTTFIPSSTAPIVAHLLSLGAILVGKTNLDQLATGLTGCRSPFGIPRCVLDPNLVPGGSSSGSAVSVGAGLVSFTVSTDTAGSGRVPAGFNGIVGFKPTRSAISFQGVVTACRGLDCIGLMAKTVSEVRELWVWSRGAGEDPYRRLAGERPIHIRAVEEKWRIGIPPEEKVLAICNATVRNAFYRAIAKLVASGRAELVPVDWEPFEKAGGLLYDGSFVNERLAGLPGGGRDWVQREAESLHPVIRGIFEEVVGRNTSGEDVFRDINTMVELTSHVQRKTFSRGPGGIDVLLVPTAPFHPSLVEVEAEPIATNRRLGYFTHFANVLDMTGVAVPVQSDRIKKPESVTLLADREGEWKILELGELLGDLCFGKSEDAGHEAEMIAAR